MKYSAKLLWGEGLFLRPQHFQLQDAYHESKMAEMARTLHPYAWGIRHIKLDLDALSTGVLRISEISAIFPDGESYNAPGIDDLPATVPLEIIPTGTTDMTFYIGLPPLRDFGSNFTADRTSGAAVRFHQADVTATDMFTNAAEAQVTLLKKAVRVLADVEPREQFLTLPMARVRRTATGSYELDPTFIPPAASIRSVPALFTQLRRLLDVLQAKVDALYGFHREPSKHVIEFRSGDIASFWLLHTASSAFAALSHVYHHPQLHPERLFQQLLQLAGALMTFSKTYTLADLPVYSHPDPGPAFAKLDTIIRELLETVISTRYFAIALSEIRPSYHAGRLDSDKINADTAFYLAVETEMPPAELVTAVPARFKLGAPDDVEKLVLSAMPGVRLTHIAQVPPAIPVRPGAYYFSVEPRGPLYERMLQAQSILIYVPEGMRSLKLELVALTP